MSQLGSPAADSQSVLQSMLQRLKLQSGTDSQGCLPQFSPTAPPGCASPRLHKLGALTSSPVNGFGVDGGGSPHGDSITRDSNEEGIVRSDAEEHEIRKWDSREEPGIPAWDRDFAQTVPSDEERMHMAHVPELGSQRRIHIHSAPSDYSASSHKDIIVRDRGDNKGMGELAFSSVVTTTPKVSGIAWKEVDVTSSENTVDKVHRMPEKTSDSMIKKSTDAKTVRTLGTVSVYHDNKGASNHNSPLNSQLPNQNNVTEAQSRTMREGQANGSYFSHVSQGFTPRVYAWSLKTTEAKIGTGSEEKDTLPLDSGGFGLSPEAKDTEILSSSQSTVISTAGSKSKTLLSDTKQRRWTQRIKDRLKVKRGSSKRKVKEKERNEEVKMTNADLSRQNQPSTVGEIIKVSNNDGEATPFSHISTDHRDVIGVDPILSEKHTDGNVRPTSYIGLGSFSLLEEILTGQEWAQFLKPTLLRTTANERPTGQTPQHPHGQSSETRSKPTGVKDRWNSRGTESARASDVLMTPVSTDVSTPDSMDVTEPSNVCEQDTNGKAIHSETIEQGYRQSDIESEEIRWGFVNTTQEKVFSKKSIEVLDNSALKARISLTRKRVYQSQERRTGREPEVDKTEKDESFSEIVTGQAAKMSEELQDENQMMSLYHSRSPGSSHNSLSRGARIVPILRHSESHDSACSVSMETMPKKRRVEDTRHVHFCEEVVAIEAPADWDITDSEEDCGSEDDSVIEEETENNMTVVKELVVPAPRTILPAWILALKRKGSRKASQ